MASRCIGPWSRVESGLWDPTGPYHMEQFHYIRAGLGICSYAPSLLRSKLLILKSEWLLSLLKKEWCEWFACDLSESVAKMNKSLKNSYFFLCFCRAGNSVIGFLSESLVFAQQWANERFTLKNERFTHSLMFGERPERFAHDRSHPLSDVSKLLMVSHFWCALPKRFAHMAQRKWAIVSESLTLLTKKEEMSKNERFAYFSINFFKILYKTY